MSLMQQAYDTYQFAAATRAGVYYANENEPLAPVGHTITKAAIEITINGAGRFIQASAVAKGDEKTIFPVTEDSAGRTSSPVAHPLCDQLQYLLPIYEKKYSLYVDQLAQWNAFAGGDTVLTAILTYVTGGTMLTDLAASDLLKYDAKGNLACEKSFVRWIVEGIGEDGGPCWKNRRLQNSYIEWYQSQQDTDERDYCMISGICDVKAKQHAKGIVALNGNAKLISANDTSGFTYRGRFLNDAEAMNVSYDVSQKLHNALRWVIVNQGIYFGGRNFVCWNPQGLPTPKVTGGIFARNKEQQPSYTPTAYKENLSKVLNSWKAVYPKDAKAVTAVFDAATTGRLALTYYSELQAIDFVDRLAWWDETCCWHNGDFGIQAPNLQRIATYAFGTLRDTGYEADDQILKQVMLQLVTCRVEKAPMPVMIERALVQHAGNLQIVPDDKEHKYLRRDLLFTTCAVIRKYHIDRNGEEWNMALEPENKNRSYLFGRLMAILEKIEKDTYGTDDKRETNIIRRQMAYTARPYATAASVIEHLKVAYYPQLSVAARNYYEKQIENIMALLSEDAANLNRPLEDTYLLGYYLQKKELYTSNKAKVEE